MQQIAFRSDDADLAVCDLDTLGERPKVVTAVAAASDPYALAGSRSKFPHPSRRDDLLAGAFERGGCSLGFGLRLFADRLEPGDAVFERWVVQISHAAFDGVIQPLEP